MNVDIRSSQGTLVQQFNLTRSRFLHFAKPYLATSVGPYLDFIDINTGDLIYTKTYDKSLDIYGQPLNISKVYSNDSKDGFLVGLGSKIIDSESEKFIDHIFSKRTGNISILPNSISDDQTKLLSHGSLIDTKTLKVLKKFIDGYVFYNDSLIYFTSGEIIFGREYPNIYNINKDEVISFDLNIYKAFSDYTNSNNKLFAIFNEEQIVNIDISTGNFRAISIYKFEPKLDVILYDVSSDNKYVAILYKEQSFKLRVYDAVSQKIIYDETLSKQGSVNHLKFIKNTDEIFFTVLNPDEKISNIAYMKASDLKLKFSNDLTLNHEYYDQGNTMGFTSFDYHKNRFVYQGKRDEIIFLDKEFKILHNETFKSTSLDDNTLSVFNSSFVEQIHLWKVNSTISLYARSTINPRRAIHADIFSTFDHNNNKLSEFLITGFTYNISKIKPSIYNIFSLRDNVAIFEQYYLKDEIKLVANISNSAGLDPNYSLSDDDSKFLATDGSKIYTFDLANKSVSGLFDARQYHNNDFVYNNSCVIQYANPKITQPGNIIYINDIASGNLIEQKVIEKSNIYPHRIVKFLNIPGRNSFVTAHQDGTIRFWDKGTNTPKHLINTYSPVSDMLLIQSKYLIAKTTDNLLVGIQLNDFQGTSVEDTEDNSIEFSMKIYPNPSSEFIEIKINSGELSDKKLKVINPLGIDVTSICNINSSNNFKTVIRVDISMLPSGVYIIQIGEKTEKFVKI
ncbi:MAG: T9SS type A sorting domain-containing protein [Candidatus Kapabacteria bacterium]|nr:T9SS type A sorting domain-containing protein [Ignavibacteriota bacterium]MCW5883966.1 T9SS type A sorting domain-containing protein [Candidatus Kapabacteria bacterium]